MRGLTGIIIPGNHLAYLKEKISNLLFLLVLCADVQEEKLEKCDSRGIKQYSPVKD